MYSARYAGPAKNSEDNMHKVLGEMKGEENRKARFRTVIALLLGGEEHFFEGIVEGKILEQQQGEIGFGYDPIFCPEGYRQSFAEMPMEQKNQISHRGQAVRKLADVYKRQILMYWKSMGSIKINIQGLLWEWVLSELLC